MGFANAKKQEKCKKLKIIREIEVNDWGAGGRGYPYVVDLGMKMKST